MSGGGSGQGRPRLLRGDGVRLRECVAQCAAAPRLLAAFRDGESFALAPYALVLAVCRNGSRGLHTASRICASPAELAHTELTGRPLVLAVSWKHGGSEHILTF